MFTKMFPEETLAFETESTVKQRQVTPLVTVFDWMLHPPKTFLLPACLRKPVNCWFKPVRCISRYFSVDQLFWFKLSQVEQNNWIQLNRSTIYLSIFTWNSCWLGLIGLYWYDAPVEVALEVEFMLSAIKGWATGRAVWKLCVGMRVWILAGSLKAVIVVYS